MPSEARATFYRNDRLWLFSFSNRNKEVTEMSKEVSKGGERFQTNAGGIIKAPRTTQQPKSDVKKGKDLRTGK